MLAGHDRSTPVGRRNYAILLLLARLGLRAGEVVTLDLEDVDLFLLKPFTEPRDGIRLGMAPTMTRIHLAELE